MKASELIVGKTYKIAYRTDLKKRQASSSWYSSGYMQKTTLGVGVLVKMHSPASSVHEFKLVGSGTKVYVTSNGVTAMVEGVLAGDTAMIANDDPELAALVALGFDEDTRREQVDSVNMMFAGLGVNADPTPDYTRLTIPFKELMKLKKIFGKVYGSVLMSDLED